MNRQHLAVGVCEREGWVNVAGEPCVTSARVALAETAVHAPLLQ